MTKRAGWFSLLLLVCPVGVDAAAPKAAGDKPADTSAAVAGGLYSPWKTGPWNDANFFPIGVWAQEPGNAPRYRGAGINLYVGLHKGPTEGQLADLKKAGMPVICAQNEVGLEHKDDPAIIGWIQGDEPDLARDFKKAWDSNLAAIGAAWPEYAGRTEKDWGEYGPPKPPAWIQQTYQKWHAADATRPILVNFGPPVAEPNLANDRGVRTRHNEDYVEYSKGADIVSFDIYPLNDRRPWAKNKLEMPARGVANLREWTGGKKPVWFCVEGGAVSGVAPTPEQVRSEVWMALIRGGTGIIYFVHQFKPTFNETYLLDDAGLLAGVTALNRQIAGLAPVLNSPTVEGAVEIASSNKDAPVIAMAKRRGGATYVFAACTGEAVVKATFTVKDMPIRTAAEVLGEGRTAEVIGGKFSDDFKPYEVHLYRIK